MTRTTDITIPTDARRRARLVVRGAVQGVGFRPGVYRLATTLGLAGWVANTAQGAVIDVEGPAEAVDAFLLRLDGELPPRAAIHSRETTLLDPAGYATFEIRPSDDAGARTALVMPDIAACADCLREVRDPANRRYRYPFTNCTNCGPRYSIIAALPYDRLNTTMRGFVMCPACRAEYDDPADRRFHAQPNACPVCGPRLALWDAAGAVLAEADDALLRAADAIRAGAIVAVKGLGGFHLLVDAGHEEAVTLLRRRKGREEKPLAVMCPSLAAACALCTVDEHEARLLASPEAPIVLLRQRPEAAIAPSVAPDNPTLGVMLPYTPLHALLLDAVGGPVVATSGNRSDEPICIDEGEALARLDGIADLFLVHDRPILRHVDDSVARVLLGREQVLRRARGYAPLPLPLPGAVPPALAVGAHLKSTVALAAGGEAFLSQHLGDLDTVAACDAFARVIDDLQALYAQQPTVVACDLHPDYHATRWAEGSGLPVVHVQHHEAHMRAGMADNALAGPLLGVAWDGTGAGTDGTVWGGEFFHVTDACARVASFRTFCLPGGDAAVKEPRRTALGVLYELFGDDAFTLDLPPVRACTDAELDVLRGMLARGVHAPRTSSVGRLFDAAASLLDLRQRAAFEGQAAMLLEFAIGDISIDEAYPVALRDGDPPRIDWFPLVRGMLEERDRSRAEVAAKFHNTLAAAVVAVAERVGEPRVLLSGGCFQNAYLTTETVRRLRAAGFRPYWHQRVPPNDGGIALGQLCALAPPSSPTLLPPPEGQERV
jgi:hydrogenase maturation protein HypF